MIGSEGAAMNSVERNLVWLGYEDYTGLLQAALEMRDVPGLHSTRDAQDCARQVLESLLSRGWIELYLTEGALDNETISPVRPEDRLPLLESDPSWSSSDEGKRLVWFATTDEGFLPTKRQSDGNDSRVSSMTLGGLR